jgi:hypothetical protein
MLLNSIIGGVLLSTTTPTFAQDGIDTALVSTILVERMQLLPGERVLLVAVPGRSDALISALRSRFAAARVVDLGVLVPTGAPDASWVTDFTLEHRTIARRWRATSARSISPSCCPV